MDHIFEKATGLPPLSPRSQFLYGHGDEYFHPGTSEAQQLEAQGYHLPQPGDYTYPPINPLCDVHPISAGLLSSNIVNTLAAGGTEDHDSSTSKNSKKVKKGRTKKAKANKDGTGTSDRAVFGENDLVILMCLVLEKPPYLEPHGSKGAAWEEIAQRYASFCLYMSS
jgi:hypothetical protein